MDGYGCWRSLQLRKLLLIAISLFACVQETQATFIPLTVRELDGSPSVTKVKTISVNGATLSDLNNGHVLMTISGGGGSASGTAGAVQFSSGTTFSSDASNLFWDDANNRLGIGTNNPARAKTRINIASAAEQGLVLRAAVGQTGNFTQFETVAGQVVASVGPDGTYYGSGNDLLIGGHASTWYGLWCRSSMHGVRAYGMDVPHTQTDLVFSANTREALRITTNGAVLINNFTAGSKGVTVKGAASQTANLQEWQNVNGSVLANISSSGAATFSDNLSIGSTVNSILTFLPTYGLGVSIIDFKAQGSGLQDARIASGVGSSPNILFYTTNGTSLTERFRIQASGVNSTVPSSTTVSSITTTIGADSGYATIDVSGSTGLWVRNLVGVSNNSGILNFNVGGGFIFSPDAGIKVQKGSGVDYAKFYSTSGGFSLGTGYAGITAPTNGAILEGRLGVGISAPARKLHISEAMRLEPQSSPPASPVLGDLYVDSDSNELCFFNGTVWTGMVAGGACS